VSPRVRWYRNNRSLALVLPFLIVAGAITQTTLDGAAKQAGLVVTIVLLLAFIAQVTLNAARGRR